MEKIYSNFAGMDLDTSPEKFNPNYYSTAYNTRIGSNIGNVPSTTENKKGSIEGIKNIGAVLSSLFVEDSVKIICLTRVRDYLVFILSTSTTQAIYKILEYELNTITNPTPFFQWNKSELTLNEDTTTLLGRYETDKLIKIYITDGTTYLKSINLAVSSPTSIKQLEVFKPIDMLTTPSFTISSGGSLKAGNVAYGVQYYALNSSASNYIPIGPIQPILKGDITDSKLLTGGALNETTDKLANISIPAVNGISGFNYAKVVRIHYTLYGELPTITIVYDGAISNTETTIIKDSGQTLGNISGEEYALVINPFKCSTIEQKNNILFAGNILQSEFSVDYDARIRRYNYIAQSQLDISTIYEVDYHINYAGNYPINGYNVQTSTQVNILGVISNLLSNFNSPLFEQVPDLFINNFNNQTTSIICSLVSKNIQGNSGTFKVRYKLDSHDFLLINSELTNSNPVGFNLTSIINKIQIFTPAGTPTIAVNLADLNPYNDPNKTTFTNDESYKFKLDGHGMGGSGINGGYSIYRSNTPIYNTTTKKPVYTDNIYKRTFQRNEIYGFALVGFDEYMRPSFAKFIDDVKMPGFNEPVEDSGDPIRDFNQNLSNVIYQEGIYVNFGFNNLPESIKYCAVVRTSREGGDGTVADMCLLNPLWDAQNGDTTFNIGWDNVPSLSNWSQSIMDYYELISLKTVTNKLLPAFDKVEYYYANEQSPGIKYGNVNRYSSDKDETTVNRYNTEVYNITGTTSNIGVTTPADKYYYPYNTNKDAVFQVGGKQLRSYTVIPTTTYSGFKGCCGVIQTPSSLSTVGNSSGVPIMFGLMKRNTYPYGGYTQAAIEQRTWILSSDITKVVNGSVTLGTIGYGDVYAQIIPYTRILKDVVRANFGKDIGNTCYIPLESSILYKGVAGKTWDNYYNYADNVTEQPYDLIQESKGVWTNSHGASFTQENDLYNYNSAYSTDNKSKVYITKPSVYNPQSNFDCLVKNSDRKINGEIIDSWTSFKPNNKIELDTSRGKLVDLVNLNNTLFFIQEAGGGTLSVDEREMISSGNAGSLYLGTGGVLNRFDYIFTNYGARAIDSVTNTNNYIYFYDASAGKFCRMNSQSAEILSDVKNCKSYFSKLLYANNFNTTTNYVLGADNLRQEIYMKPSNSDTGIVFNELWNDFESLTTIPFTKIFTTEDIMYFQIPNTTTFNPFSGKGKFLYGMFPTVNPDLTNTNYDNLEYSLDKSVEFIISNQLPCRLDLIEWTSKNYTPLSNTLIDEIYEIYQEDTLFKTFVDNSINGNPRFFNKKRYNQIYNVNNRARCKGNYFKIKYIGNPDKLKKANFTLNSFNVYVTPLINR